MVLAPFTVKESRGSESSRDLPTDMQLPSSRTGIHFQMCWLLSCTPHSPALPGMGRQRVGNLLLVGTLHPTPTIWKTGLMKNPHRIPPTSFRLMWGREVAGVELPPPMLMPTCLPTTVSTTSTAWERFHYGLLCILGQGLYFFLFQGS